MDRLFVYGSLRRGAGHPMAEQLADAAIFEGSAVLAGRLYAVSWYPGAVLDASGQALVHGELWRIRAPDLLKRLDAYEGCGPADRPPLEFVRVGAQVRTDLGERVRAWVYVYAREVDERRRVHSGDWLRRDPGAPRKEIGRSGYTRSGA